MSQISISSHDLLGKLSILKNSLFMINLKAETLGEKEKEYLDVSVKTVQEIIDLVKGLAEKSSQ